MYRILVQTNAFFFHTLIDAVWIRATVVFVFQYGEFTNGLCNNNKQFANQYPTYAGDSWAIPRDSG